MQKCSGARMLYVHPIAIVEIEVSPWSYEEETKKFLQVAKELNITVAAYALSEEASCWARLRNLTIYPRETSGACWCVSKTRT